MTAQHPEHSILEKPGEIDDRYLKDRETLPYLKRRIQEVKAEMLPCGCGTIMETMRKAWYSPTPRNYLIQRELLYQPLHDIGHHRYLEGFRDERPPHYNLLNHSCEKGKRLLTKPLPWWVLYLHLPEAFITKRLTDTMLGCHVSHRCHWGPCLVVSDIEIVPKSVNDDRNRCKNGSRR